MFYYRRSLSVLHKDLPPPPQEQRGRNGGSDSGRSARLSRANQALSLSLYSSAFVFLSHRGFSGIINFLAHLRTHSCTKHKIAG